MLTAVRFISVLRATLVRGCAEMVEMLVVRGIDIDAYAATYDNVLQAAYFNSHEDMIEIPLAGDTDAYTAGIVACSKQHHSMHALLANSTDTRVIKTLLFLFLSVSLLANLSIVP